MRSGYFVINIGLAFVLVLMWTSIIFGNRDTGQRNFRFMPNMEDSLAFESQRDFPLTAARPRPETVPGTVSREALPLGLTGSPEDALRAGLELKSPLAPEPANLERGKRIFLNQCALCHGTTGEGGGPVTRRGVPAPPSLLESRARGMADGQIFHIITFGQGNMPSHASQVDRVDRWKAILFIRSLQRAGDSATGRREVGS